MKIEDILIGCAGIGIVGYDIIKIPLIKAYGKLRGIEYETVFNEDNGFIDIVSKEKISSYTPLLTPKIIVGKDNSKRHHHLFLYTFFADTS